MPKERDTAMENGFVVNWALEKKHTMCLEMVVRSVTDLSKKSTIHSGLVRLCEWLTLKTKHSADLRVNLFVLGGNCIEMEQGYALKKRILKRWIYDQGYTQPYIARKLGLFPEQFKRKLRECEIFDRRQIEILVGLMKADAAFQVLYFPTSKQRRQIYGKVFG